MSSQERILRLFLKMLAGETIYKNDMVEEFYRTSPDEHEENLKKQVQRDIAIIRNALFYEKEDEGAVEAVTSLNNASQQFDLVSRGKGAYALESNGDLKDGTVIAILKILLESRALSKGEMTHIVKWLLKHAQDKEFVEKMILSEAHNYSNVVDHDLNEKIEIISQGVSKRKPVKFKYHSNDDPNKLKKYIPEGIYFSEFYFYMIVMDGDKPKAHRLDKMFDVQLMQNSQLSANNVRFKTGDYNKIGSLAFFGKPETYEIEYLRDEKIILDKFPNSKVMDSFINKDSEDVKKIKLAGTDTEGMMMWLLSQGENLIVKSPPSKVAEIKEKIEKMQKNYE